MMRTARSTDTRPSAEPAQLPPASTRPTWTFLTNHGHVLLAVATSPDQRVSDIAAEVGITTRATLTILGDLEEALLVAVLQRLQTYDLPFHHARQVLPHVRYSSLGTR